LTFGLSWGVWVPLALLEIDHPVYKLGTFGPTIVALVLTGVQEGRQGLQELWKRLQVWRVSWFWYLFSVLSTAGVALAAIGLHAALGGAVGQFNDPAQFYLVVPAFLYVLFTSVLGEEIGWRGYALPRLQARYRALGASLILGLVWGVWHLPLFWTAGNFHRYIPVSVFLLQVVGFSVLYTWMNNNTRGSLLMPHLFHAASNTTLGLLPILPTASYRETRPLWFGVGLLWVIVGVVVVIYGPGRLSRREA
jgi:membrane protease YdiL (CAAX protease family)